MDIVGSALILILCTPLLLMIALAIKASSKGPVFFRQQRVGQYGQSFVFLKFRSMHTDNDHSVHREYVTKLIAGEAESEQSNGNGDAHIQAYQRYEGYNEWEVLAQNQPG